MSLNFEGPLNKLSLYLPVLNVGNSIRATSLSAFIIYDAHIESVHDGSSWRLELLVAVKAKAGEGISIRPAGHCERIIY